MHYTTSGIITPIGGRLVHRSTCFEHMCSSSGGQEVGWGVLRVGEGWVGCGLGGGEGWFGGGCGGGIFF